MTTQTFKVIGMTCDHCAAAVTEELLAVSGVTGVTVDVPHGTVVVASQQELSDEAVRAAIDEAGYALVA